MSDPTPAADPTLANRVTELEILVMHMQADFQKINSVVLDQQREIDALTKSLDRLGSKVDKLGEEPEKRDPLQERPPHY